MDLRIEKTQKAIRQAYISLKEEKPLPKIRVTEICERALINKSTFYKYYLDVYDLADKVETEVVSELLGGCKHITELFTDPEAFADDVGAAMNKYYPYLSLVFDGRVESEISKVEKYLINIYYSNNYTKKEEHIIRFLVGGATHVVLTTDWKNEDLGELMGIYKNMIKKLKE